MAARSGSSFCLPRENSLPAADGIKPRQSQRTPVYFRFFAVLFFAADMLLALRVFAADLLVLALLVFERLFLARLFLRVPLVSS